MSNIPWNIHPRPQMKREQWQSLNGTWLLNNSPITVPYPPQSSLSGYGQPVPEQFCYERSFRYPEHFRHERCLLHFDAVDQIAEIWLNGKRLGSHTGGYLPFTFDITDVVSKDADNHLKVLVTDRSAKCR